MQIIKNTMAIADLQKIANPLYGDLVKAVVDTNKRILAIDAGLHADLEHFLLEQGSDQEDLWGINLHPSLHETPNFIEYDSMINLRPNQNNFSRGVDDVKICTQIEQIVNPLFSK